MKHFFMRTQLVFVSILLFATFSLTLVIVMRHNKRWDFTKEKIYSLSEPTGQMLDKMTASQIEVLGFYPEDDPGKKEFEFFLKQAALRHPRFKYDFYDPDRVPRLAKDYDVKDLYTAVIKYNGVQERLVRPTEESFTNALLRLSNPKNFQVCFVTGHEEASTSHEDRNGLSYFRQSLEFNNYKTSEIILLRDGIPDACLVVAVVGPHRDMEQSEFDLLAQFFGKGKGILFLIDPMDPGTGEAFRAFMKRFGVALGADVVVDKMSRMVGGDFLVPLVSQYVLQHPITAQFKLPTFYPVARTVQPATDGPKELEVTPLAFTGSGSWAESNLGSLEKGETNFEAESDVSGPLSLAVASEKKDASGQPGGRLVVVGDSDFVTNAYLDLSGNRDLALGMVNWLTKDERAITINPRRPEFKPLFLKDSQRTQLLLISLGAFPFFFLIAGGLALVFRNSSS